MKFTELPLKDAFLIELEMRGDERGFFARLFCQHEHKRRGLFTKIAQVNNSLGLKQGTLRGLHYQLPPHSETKIIRCIRGAVWDAILDLRTASPTFGKWFGEKLTADNRRMIYAPKGFAHGFITLKDNSEIIYLVDEYYDPQVERTVRWNDPTFGIEWPVEPTQLSEKDARAPLFDPAYHLTDFDLSQRRCEFSSQA